MATASEITVNTAEQRSLTRAKWGNLFMGAAGILAGWLSNSQAVMVDGLFSLIGFFSAILAVGVSRNSRLEPDRLRPFGYASDEAIFMTFRALSLLGLVVFAIVNAGRAIVSYALGDPAPPLRFDVAGIYFVVIGITCFLLALSHHMAWKRMQGRSEVLRLEAKAAVFDGVLTVSAGAGLFGVYFLKDTKIGFVTPVGDSLVALLLCLLMVGSYWKEFRRGLAELAGVTAPPEKIAIARRAVREPLREAGGRLVDLSLTRAGRSYYAALFYDPGRPVTAREIDDLTRRVEAEMERALGPNHTLVQVSEYPRNWGERGARK